MDSPNSFGEILLVEDNPGDVRLTKELFKESDLDPSIHVVSDGSEALEFLQQRGEYRGSPRPDLILLDLHLSRMDGEELLEELDGELQEIPIIAISGSRAGAASKLDDLRENVDACLEKPVEPDDLREATRST